MPTKEFRKSFKNTIDSLHISICELTLQNNDNFYKLLRSYYSFIHQRTQTLFYWFRMIASGTLILY